MLGKKNKKEGQAGNLNNELEQGAQQGNEDFNKFMESAQAKVDAEKDKQLSRRERKQRKEYERLIKVMTPEEAKALQDKRDAEEVLDFFQTRSKKAIKQAARKRMGIRSRVKSVVVGAILGGAGYLGLSQVVNTESREVARKLTEEEYRNEVAKNYLIDGQKIETFKWDNDLVDWNSPDWYDQWLNALAMQHYPALSEDLKDVGVVNAILDGGDYSFVYRDYLMQAPNGGLFLGNTRYAMAGTPEERMEVYSYAFKEKWGMDPTTMSKDDDAAATLEILNTMGDDKCSEFIDNLALYRSMVEQNSEYQNDFEAVEFVGWKNDEGIYYNYDNFADYLDAKEAALMEKSYDINGVDGYIDQGDFVQQVTSAIAEGNQLAKDVWHEYISIMQARLMCAEDELYFATPSEILPMFGIDSTDPMFQKYAELGGDEAIVARLLMIEHPGCNTFHADGSIHMTDAGTLTGEALAKFNEDLAFYQDLLAKGDELTALEYANMLYALDVDVGVSDAVTINDTVMQVVPGDDPLTHIGIPSAALFVGGYTLSQRHKFKKAVEAEIMADMARALVNKGLKNVEIADELQKDSGVLDEAQQEQGNAR